MEMVAWIERRKLKSVDCCNKSSSCISTIQITKIQIYCSNMHPVIACTDDCLFISTLEKACLVYKLSKDEICSSPFLIESKVQTSKDVDIEAKGVALHAAFSNSGEHIAICNDYKQLLLYCKNIKGNGTLEWTLISSRATSKKVVKIEFVSDGSCLVVADKLGIVTSYSVRDPEKEGVVLLGHISVLLDCKFIKSGAYLATADRDEKVRISCYPDTFDIQAFCLGHTKYVTCLAEAESLLLSGSGDGTVKLWEPITGKLLSEILCSDNNSVVQQILYMPNVKKAVCLLNGCDRLVCISLEFTGTEACLKQEVEEVNLTATAITFCKYSSSSVIVLVDSTDRPLQLITLGDSSSSNDRLSCLPTICQDLKSRWALFAGAIKYQREFYTDVTKMDLQSIEQDKKRKTESSSSNGSEDKALKC